MLEELELILDSVEYEEVSVQDAILQIRELIQHFENENDRIQNETTRLRRGTEQLRYGKFVLNDYQSRDHLKECLKESGDGFDNLVVDQTNQTAERKEVKKEIEIKKEIKTVKTWTCPEIDAIDESCFNGLNRHQKGRLKYSQLTNAIGELNVLLHKKYKLLHDYNKKKKSMKNNPDALLYLEESHPDYNFTFSERDIQGTSFYRLKHTKDTILNILKNQGRVFEKRRPRQTTLYCLLNPYQKYVPLS